MGYYRDQKEEPISIELISIIIGYLHYCYLQQFELFNPDKFSVTDDGLSIKGVCEAKMKGCHGYLIYSTSPIKDGFKVLKLVL